MTTVFTFPNPVNEVAARLVAAGVVAMALLAVLADVPWLMPVLAYGFVARVAAGPRFSPLAQVVLRVVVPRLPVEPRWVAGPPKRFAQGMGAAMSAAAVVCHFGFGLGGVADVLLLTLAAAATLESVFALCLGCKVFGVLMRLGVVPDDVCAACADIRLRPPPAAA